MASKTEIANRAITKLGEDRVTNVDTENVKSAKTIREMWDIERRALLSAFPWSFAITRVQMAREVSTPAWGYSYQYALPSDFLALIEIYGDPDYSLESDATGGQRILTDEGGPLYIKYIRDVTNTSEFDPFFVASFASKLALEACETITQSNNKKQVLFDEYRLSLKAAYAGNSIQNKPQGVQDTDWGTARGSDW